MSVSVWSQLTDEQKFELLKRRYIHKESVTDLANELGMNALTLNRNLQRLRASLDDTQPEWKDSAGAELPKALAPRIEFPAPKPMPTYQDMIALLRKGPVSLDELSRRFDRSKETIAAFINEMQDAGYVVQRIEQQVSADLRQRPHVTYAPARTLADEMGQEVVFGVISDSHFGSTHAQVSARHRFIHLANEEYGVQHFFDPGDLTTGVGGYRGQEHDIIPAIRPRTSKDYPVTTEGQIWLADACTPQLPGVRYYELGGNHDYWHVVNSGVDAVAAFCRRRNDSIFLGYDMADIPLTDRVSVRLWHPGGGGGFGLSNKLQKGMDAMAMDELRRAVENNEDPKVRFLLAGHLHVEVKFQRGPMVAAHVGCFEGQTNYEKRLGLYPTIGGCIFKVRLTDSGQVQRVEYTFIPFNEVENDWQNWPVPPATPILAEPDDVAEPLFQLA